MGIQDGQPHRNRGSFPHGALDFEPSAHEFTQLSGQCETKTNASRLAGGRGVYLLKCFEGCHDLFLRHPHAIILDLEDNPRFAVDRFLRSRYFDVSLLGELRGVAKKVQKGLTHACGVSDDATDGRWDMNGESVMVLSQQGFEDSRDLMNNRLGFVFLRGDLHIASFDA